MKGVWTLGGLPFVSHIGMCRPKSRGFGPFWCENTLPVYINYCNLIWASTYASYLGPLYLLQKKAIRIITFSAPRTRSKPLFSKLNILSLHSLYKFHVSCFVFSHFNHLLPASLSSLLYFNRDFHDYLTRSRFNLHKMSLRHQFAISSQAPTIWNDIPLTVRVTALPLVTSKIN